jgi:hypothetical protein
MSVTAVVASRRHFARTIAQRGAGADERPGSVTAASPPVKTRSHPAREPRASA